MTALSLRARLTLWCVAVVALVVALFAADVLLIQGRISLERIDRELESTHQQLTRMLGEELAELDSPRLAAQESRDVIASSSDRLAVLTEAGEVLTTSFDTPGAADLLASKTATPGVRTVETSRGQWRVQLTREAFPEVALLVLVGRPLSDVTRDQRDIRQAMLLAIPIALILAAAGGLWLASVGLQPITAMAQRAADLPLNGDEDLGPPARNDELGRLTQAFNALVGRLRAALQTQRQFMADASHELRTPVSIIRSASDIALSRDHRDESEYRETLTMTSAESHRLGTLVDDMLVIARTDAGGYPLRPVEFFLDDVVDECRRAVSVLAAERLVQLTASGVTDVAVRGDQDLLRRLLVNLLQNALHHTPAGGTVSLDVAVNGVVVCVRVIDTGSGIPEADQSRIFTRFVQLDSARRSGGAGLGLTIARWIAEAHQGSLVVESSGPSGTTFRLELPVAIQLARA